MVEELLCDLFFNMLALQYHQQKKLQEIVIIACKYFELAIAWIAMSMKHAYP